MKRRRLGEGLRSLGLRNVWDLLTYYPRRHIDRTREATISELSPGEEGTLLVEVAKVHLVPPRRKGRPRVEVVVKDGEGARMLCVFFNQFWRERQLKPGMELTIFGKMALYSRRRQMVNPVVDLLGDRTLRIIPVYPQSEKAGVSSWDVGLVVSEALRRCGPRGIADPVEGRTLRRYGLCSREEAFSFYHAPEDFSEIQAGRRRLVFDELLRMQLFLAQRRQEYSSGRGVTHRFDRDVLERFWEGLPFALTGAQSRAIEEILSDMRAEAPMQRLLHGEVGSGKTVVALSAMLAAVHGGRQAALMSPTEVLAEQHFANLTRLLGDGAGASEEMGRWVLRTGGGSGSDAGGGGSSSDAGDGGGGSDASDGSKGDGARDGSGKVFLELLTGRSRPIDRRETLAGLASGEVGMVVGTHALISEGIEFGALGLAVIDEQHRFGVEQRASLRAKGASGCTPDVLVMTATPIPRTAALTVYGDLDVSKLDEMPTGRAGVRTEAVPSLLEAGRVWKRLKTEVAAGRQAYVVCPVIDHSEQLETAAATQVRSELEKGELSGLRLGLLHGRVPVADRERVMDGFREGKIDVMVATTMIEVGVDVPNASVMVILGAERFGIAQLHQLRGRVGRSSHLGWCFLVGGDPTGTLDLGLDDYGAAAENPRIRALVETTDGFELAETDLEIRGEGTLMAKRQTGRSDLKLASLRRDKDWVARAREEARRLVEGGLLTPELRDELDVCAAEVDAEFLEKT